jgi:hypothetical protein
MSAEEVADIVSFVSGEDTSELAQVKAELAYMSMALDRELSISRLAELANQRISKWLSAALEDPAVCEEMKADIRAWLEHHDDDHEGHGADPRRDCPWKCRPDQPECLCLKGRGLGDVKTTPEELTYIANQQAWARSRYPEDDAGLIRESLVIEWALRVAAKTEVRA